MAFYKENVETVDKNGEAALAALTWIDTLQKTEI